MKMLENRISSREVAEMMEVREHTQMLKKIDKINEVLVKSNLTSPQYWTESTYIDSQYK